MRSEPPRHPLVVTDPHPLLRSLNPPYLYLISVHFPVTTPLNPAPMSLLDPPSVKPRFPSPFPSGGGGGGRGRGGRGPVPSLSLPGSPSHPPRGVEKPTSVVPFPVSATPPSSEPGPISPVPKVRTTPRTEGPCTVRPVTDPSGAPVRVDDGLGVTPLLDVGFPQSVSLFPLSLHATCAPPRSTDAPRLRPYQPPTNRDLHL